MRSLLACARRVVAAPAHAALNVFATVPEWGALAEELGGDKVKVYAATNALQDPHHVEAQAQPHRARAQRRPRRRHRRRARDRLAAARDCSRRAIRRCSRASPATSRPPPFVHAARQARRASIAPRATSIPAGDPHIQTDPRNIARVAAPLAARLAELDPAQRRVLPGALQGVRRALERGDRAAGRSRRRR